MSKKILYWCAGLILTIPLLITPFTLYPYVHGKTLMTIGVMLIGLAIFLYARYRGSAPSIGKSPIFVTVMVFLGCMLTVSFFGVNFERSFWGSWPRLLGLFHIMIISIFAFAWATNATKTDWRRLMRLGLYISAIVSGLAILQKFFPLFVWHGYRVGSTLDNPSFLAGYLIFIIFWGLLLLVQEWRWSIAIITILNGLVLIFTRTRGAVIGLIIGLILSAGVMIFKKESRRYGWRILLLVIGGLGGVLLLDWGTVQRLLVIGTGDTTVVVRLMVWKIAWQGWLAHPFLGWGFENFNAVFNVFYNPLLLKFSYGETFADKAHNFPLEILTTTGMTGIIAYIGLFVAVIYSLWRMVKIGRMEHREASLLYGLLVAYMISLSFLFDQLFTSILFLLTLGYIHSRYVSKENQSRSMRPSIFVLGMIVLFVAGWLGVIKPIMASMYNHRGTSIFETDPEHGDEYFKKAAVWAGPWQADVAAERASAIHSTLLADEAHSKASKTMIESSFRELEVINKRYPYDARFPIFIGYLGNWLGGGYAETAELVLQKSLQNLSFKRQQIRNILVENYMVREKYAEAIAFARETVKQSPTVADSHYYLGNALLLAGEEAEGFAEFKKAEELGYPKLGSKPYEILISKAVQSQKWTKVIGLYEQAIKIDPTNSLLFAQLAAVYSRIGNKEKAIQAVQEAVRLNPKLKVEAETFIKNIWK